MKKYFYFSAALAASIALLSSCNKAEPAVDAVFHLENTGRTLSDVDKTYEVREAEKAAAEAETAAQDEPEDWDENPDENWDEG